MVGALGVHSNTGGDGVFYYCLGSDISESGGLKRRDAQEMKQGGVSHFNQESSRAFV